MRAVNVAHSLKRFVIIASTMTLLKTLCSVQMIQLGFTTALSDTNIHVVFI